MKNKKISIIIALLLMMCVAFLIGAVIGEIKNVRDLEVVVDVDDNKSKTFYATIKEKNGNLLLVDGIDSNDAKFIGEFEIALDETIQITWRTETIDISELDEGDTIAITFNGEILERYPAAVTELVKIQLIDGKK